MAQDQKNRGIVIKSAGVAAIESLPIPSLDKHPEYILVKVDSVALNPTDWKHIDFVATPQSIVGCDYAGTVLAIGSSVKSSYKVGDRIAGFVNGSSALHLDYGCFANVIIGKAPLSLPIPENVSFEEAATLGVGVTTVCQGLYQNVGTPLPPAKVPSGTEVLIYGGSTATGALAIQYAKLSGYRVLTTCSPSNFAYVKELGADEVFDYNSETVVEDIKKASGGKLEKVFDCASGGDSTKISVLSMSPEGGVFATLKGPTDISEFSSTVKSTYSLAYTALGEDINLRGNDIPAKPEDLAIAGKFWALTRDLLANGDIKVHKPTVNEGGSGLEGVMAGLDLVRSGKVRGTKLVYKL